MANTVIALKKSATPTAQPTVLANGELAINYADGKLFYKHANGTILPFNTQGGNAFGTINANGTLVVAGSSEAVVTLIAGNNISIIGDAINDTITINSTGGGSNVAITTSQIKDLSTEDSVVTSVLPFTGTLIDLTIPIAAYNKANAANLLAYNTGIGANAFTSATIAGANTAVGAGANAYANLVWSRSNTRMDTVGTSTNAFTSATIAGANTAVGTGANTYLLATISGANTAVGTGANSYSAAISNTIAIAAFTKANSALPNTSGVTFAGNLNITGNVTPSVSNTHDLGSTTLRWRNIYTNDLNLNNGIGDYTIVEGEDDLFLYNNKKNKVYKFALIEIDPSEAPKKAQ